MTVTKATLIKDVQRTILVTTVPKTPTVSNTENITLTQNAFVKRDTKKKMINVCGPTHAKNATLTPFATRHPTTPPPAPASPVSKETVIFVNQILVTIVIKMQFVTRLVMVPNRANVNKGGLETEKRAKKTHATTVMTMLSAKMTMVSKR